jgi:acyl carrier protein
MDIIAQRLLTCFSAVFPKQSRQDLEIASRDAMQEWDSLASVTLLSLVNQEFNTDIDLFEFQDLGSFASLLRYLQEAVGVAGESAARG